MTEICNRCKVEGERATAKNHTEGLMWLWPDEIWVCQRCWRIETSKVVIGVPS